jgi:hypothetical protein
MKKSQEDKDIDACTRMYGKKLEEMIKLGKPGEYCLMCGKTKKEIKDKQLECQETRDRRHHYS